MLNKSNLIDKQDNESINQSQNINTSKLGKLTQKTSIKESIKQKKSINESDSQIISSQKDIAVKSGSLQVIINRLRMFYFFSEERLGINKYINSVKTLKMTLHREEEFDHKPKHTEQLGDIEFELTDF